jgi:hypothetical protein
MEAALDAPPLRTQVPRRANTFLGTQAFSGQILASTGTAALPAIGFSANVGNGFRYASTGIVFSSSSNDVWFSAAYQFVMRNTMTIGWASSTSPVASMDTLLGRAAAATVQVGLDHATAPTAQTIKAHNVTTGTGASMTLAGGTGSVAGGELILAASTTTGAATAAYAVSAAQCLYPKVTLATNMTTGFFNLPGAAGAPSGTPGTTTGFPAYWDSTNLKLYVYSGGAWKASAAFT